MMAEKRYGLIAVDKQGSNILFLNPETFAIERELNAFPPRPHELLILPKQHKAYVPIFGDGIHGDNPHPGHKIAVIDLRQRQHTGFIDISPLRAPHTARLGEDGYVYQCCENSATILAIDPETDRIVSKITVPSHNTHRLTILPSGKKLFTDNEEDASVTVVALSEGNGKVIDNIPMPGAISGIAASPVTASVIVTDGEKPQLHILDSDTHRLVKTLPLPGHGKSAQLVRFSEDGSLMVVIGDQEPIVSLFDGELNALGQVEVGEKPMDGCFSPDNRTLLIANEGAGTLSVIDIATRKVIATPSAGRGCEVLSYFVIPASE